jgi:hypothetical protein
MRTLLSGIVFALMFNVSSREAAADDSRLTHFDGLYINATAQLKLPKFFRAGVLYSGGTEGIPQFGMVTLGQTFLLDQLAVGYSLGVVMSKQAFEGVEDKVFGVHAVFERGWFRGSLASRLQAYRLPWGTVVPVVTFITRAQATLLESERFDVYAGIDAFERNLDFNVGGTLGVRFKGITLLEETPFDALLSLTDMNAFAGTPRGLGWTTYLEGRVGLVIDLDPPKEPHGRENPRVRDYGQY